MGINVLSLFDGISCARVALDRAGIEVDEYFASEVDEAAIKCSKKNFPEIVQLGDVTKLDTTSLPRIDLLIGGSPCQDLSVANRKREGLKGKKSGLFQEYLRVLRETKPRFFILENVASMNKESIEIISKELGVNPILFDALLVSGQERARLFWTNIPNIILPEDKGILLKDILVESKEIQEKYWYKVKHNFLGEDKKVCALLEINGYDILKRVNSPNFKSPTLTCCRGGNLQKKVYQDGKCRKLIPLEYERLQGLPDNYTFCLSDSERYNTTGNGFNVDVIAHILKNIDLTKLEEKQDGNTTNDGIPPKPKDLGILPTII